VGRGSELAALDECLAVLARRNSAALEVAGEPGMGKTRLLAELAARAQRQGCLVLTGSASELESDLPFGIFVDALDEYLHEVQPRALAPELGAVFPSLPRSAEPYERHRLHRAVRELLEALANPKPLVLILDDLHWADSGAVELLGALLRRPPSAGVLLALGVRPRQVPERLAGPLERAAGLTRIELGSLSETEARELVGDVADALYADSGGNPFYLQQLARAPRQGTAGPAVALGGIEVPRAVAAALASELALLSSDARKTLEGAAVAGDPFEPELAAAAAGLDEARVIDALDSLQRGDLVRPTDVPRRFRFRHPLVRRAVYEGAGAGWRIGAHERSAAALAARGVSAAERAHHVERSARHGDDAAVAVLREAAAEVAPRAPASAARLYGAALRVAGPAAPERAELLGAMAETHMAAGEWNDAYAAMLQALEFVPPQAHGMRVRLNAICSALEHLLGRHGEARARLEATLRSLPDETGPEAVLLMLSMVRDAFYGMDYAEMRAWAGRAYAAAQDLGDRALMASALGAQALASVFDGAVEEAHAVRETAAALIDALSDEELLRHLGLSINALAGAEIVLDRPEEASAHIERGLAVAEASGQEQLLPMLFWTGTIRTIRGRLREATDVFETAIETARVAGHDQGLAWNLFGRSLTASAAGDVATAVTTARESIELLRGMERSFPTTGAGHALAAALLADGDAAGAVDALVEAGGGDDLRQIPAAWRASALELLTRSALALGRRDAASAAAREAQAWASRLGLRSSCGMADRAQAAVALAAGDREEAARLALRSAAAFAQAGAPVESALSRALAGQALGAAGDTERAAAELDRAATEFEQLGALGHRDAAERELRRLGRRSRYRRTRTLGDGSLVEGLTERELQVARLVVDRRTNAEIAAELYLSTKTVETHLRNLFHKLGVSSRVEVARVIERVDREARV
jgi:ATP/maltotriose-dependent transcriptional regulator MalT